MLKTYILVLFLALTACAPTRTAPALGLLSASDTENVPAGILGLGQEQQTAYQLAETDIQSDPELKITLAYHPESPVADQLQDTVRSLVEGRNQPAAVALIGATTNTGTTRIATLANSFNIPVLIPSAIGDNLMPENNLWAFRLSAPGSAHAQYLFSQVLTRQAISQLTTGDEFFTHLSVGILYEQNTFGESSAVETAKAAMAQEIEIGYYGYFDPDQPEESRVRQAIVAMQTAKVHLVYIIASNPQTAQTIVSIFRDFFNFIPEDAPLLLGQSGGFASQQFMQSPQATGVIILRQQIDLNTQCPEEITTLTQAQSYAAASLLKNAIELSANQQADQPQTSIFTWPPASSADQTQLIRQQRESIRDTIKTNTFNLPCLGQTSFDINGQNENLQFEFQYAANDQPRLTQPATLLELLKIKLNRSPFE